MIRRTCVDRGGTFTDVVQVHDDGRVTLVKVPSDRAVVGDLAAGDLVFGTTVATNALLEGRGVPVTLVVTEGFADLAAIGDMTRPDLFDPDVRRAPPLAWRVIEAGGRRGADGEVLAPVRFDGDTGDDAVAVALLHSWRDGADEDAVAAAIRARHPDAWVSVGHALAPAVGYLARIETSLVDAAISPLLRAAMARDRIPAGARAMRSDGTTCPAGELRAPDAVLSGPAGGVLAVEAIARRAGFRSAVGLDMGGTSTDVCRVDVGALPRHDGERRVAGVRIARPSLEVETIAAGGGSILAFDGRALSVGPQSAGADPGPRCYGRGGPPTLTDAALAAGLVDPTAFDPPLRPDLVALPGDAEAFLEVAREAMADAVRRIATARGVDLADHALVAYGGAAGQHAAKVAERLGIDVVLVHPCAAGLCAFGQLLARDAVEQRRAVWARWPEGAPAVAAAVAALVAEVTGRSPQASGAVEAFVSMRHVGTDAAIEVPFGEDPVAAFTEAHRQRYGFDRPHPIEVVDVRARWVAPEAALPTVEDDPWKLGDQVLAGPARLDAPTTSVVVPAGWRARRADGLLWLERVEKAPVVSDTTRTPAGVALWVARFQAVAEEGGAALRRLARSVSIRERLDFSCAVFDPRGDLVATAPHVPVHLGAMGDTVRDLIASGAAITPGQAWLSNDPWAGGSHLPDLTVVTAVDAPGGVGFVASRGHHVDVGGLTPGSMPPFSRSIDDEGAVVRHLALLDGTRLREAEVRAALAASRAIDVVLADLEAQLAANRRMADRLAALGPGVWPWAAHVHDVAEEALAEVIAAMVPGEAADVLDGVPICVRLVPGDRLRIDFTGTGGPHPGNLNAPAAVVRAAVSYALRVLVRRPLPLVDGAFRRVALVCPPGSLVAPPPGVAVAGGNVETSMRIADLVLRAAGDRAAGPGTMSNLTLGGPGWSSYETIGGGEGASPRGPGASARQVHMTNTRATDPEVLEVRLPLRLRGFAIRRGSGGAGRHAGGDGLVREIEVRGPTSASLLATRRDVGAPGLAGGGEGRPGFDEICRRGVWTAWDGATTALEAGDRVRVGTPGGGGWGSEDPTIPAP